MHRLRILLLALATWHLALAPASGAQGIKDLQLAGTANQLNASAVLTLKATSQMIAESGAVVDLSLATVTLPAAFALDSEVTAAIAAHTGDATDAHAASAITNTAAGTISATNVQAALNELDTEKETPAGAQTKATAAQSAAEATAAAALSAHTGDATDAHAASAITNTAAGNIVATTVQAALDELDAEKQPLDADLTDLADGSLTGSKVGTGIDAGNITAGTLAEARVHGDIARDSEVTAAVAAHTGDPTDAHAATAITNTPAGNLAATTVQAALDELDSEKQPLDADLTDLADGSLTGSKVGTGIDAGNITTGTLAEARVHGDIARDSEVTAAVAAHTSDPADAHAATAITYTPTGSIAAITVQAALDELDSEKQPLDADLTDLADGSLTGSKVGTGIDAGNITAGTLAEARVHADLARDSEVTAAISALSTVYQGLDADLTSIAGNATGGFLTRTATNTYTPRTLTGTTNRITITNGDGVSGAPTVDIASTYVGQNTITTVGALDAGSITSGFGEINIGTDPLTAGAISGTTGTFSAATDVLIGNETGSGDGRGVIASASTAGGNAGFTWRTNAVNRWTMDLIGSADAESVRIRKLGTGAATVATFTSTGLNNTVIGATTPAAISGTTGTFTVADNSIAARIKGATGMLRLSGYVDATEGAWVQAINASENSYSVPLSLLASEIRLSPSGSLVALVGSTGVAVTGTLGATSATLTYGYPTTGLAMESDSTSSHSALTFVNPNGLVGSINTIGTSTTFNTSSGAYVKRDVVAADEAALVAAVDAIKVHEYTWRADGSKGLGVIAEELDAAVGAIAPAAVTKGDATPAESYDDWRARKARVNARAERNAAAREAHAAAVKAATDEAQLAEQSRRERLGAEKLALLDQHARQAQLLVERSATAKAEELAVAEAHLDTLEAEVAKIPAEDREPVVAQLPPEPALEHDPEDDLPDPKLWGVDYSKLVPLLIAYGQHQSKRITALEQERRVAQTVDWTTAAALVATGYLLRRRWAA